MAMIRRRGSREVATLYEALLGRAPTGTEMERHRTPGVTLGAVATAILESPEFAGREASHPLINLYTEETRPWTHAPGMRSRDGQCVVGRDGWLFLLDGSNDGFQFFTGRREVDEGWLERWRELGRERMRDLTAAGLTHVWLVVPDKLPVLERFFPDRLDGGSPDRPIRRLLRDTDLPILYPMEALRRASFSGDVYLRADSHLSLRGNDVLQREVLGALGLPPVRFSDFMALRYPRSGDLGEKFEPKIFELAEAFAHLGRARVCESNRDAFLRMRRHVGQRAVFANPTAPDERTAVVFGDSYGWTNWSASTANWVVGYQGLAWSLAQVFRALHVLWMPFGWDPGYVERAGASVVVFETAERFIVSPPAVRADAEELSRRTLAGLGRSGR